MGNCEGCPFALYCLSIDNDWKTCPVTPDHKRITDAILRGVWRCDTCELNPETSFAGEHCGDESGIPCGRWQPRKEDGDEARNKE